MRYYSINPESYGQLGIFEKQIQKCNGNEATIKVAFLRPYGIAFLHQIMMNENIVNSNKKVCSSYPNANQYLKQCGFNFLPKKVVCGKEFPQENIIKLHPIKSKSIDDDVKITNWIEKNILRFIPKLTPQLETKIIKNLWEIITNSLIHSESKTGMSICGQFYPLKGYFEVAFCDKGLGIAKIVKSHKYISENDEDYKCIEWATERGNTTKPSDKIGGLGLYFLREFIKLNKGSFQIISGQGYFGNSNETMPVPKSIKNYINGTIVNLRIIFDQNLYSI